MDMSSSKRGRGVGDRLGDLPDCLLQAILSSLGSRQAVQTSLLSRRWSRLWRDVPCIDIDERDFAGGVGEDWERLEDFADHMLTSIPPGTRLDAFRMHLTSGGCDYGTSSRWIRRGLRHLPAAVDIQATHDRAVFWRPHQPIIRTYGAGPMFRRQGGLSACAAGFTSRLTTLRLVEVTTMCCFLEDLGQHCPVLEELHAERCKLQLHVVASPTLRRLAIISPVCCTTGDAAPRLEAPRLASLRLDIPYGIVDGSGPLARKMGAAVLEPLPTLAEASVRLTEWNHRWLNLHQLEFLKSVGSFLALLSNVVNLHLQELGTMSLLDESQDQFPVLRSLKTLLLEKCDVGEEFHALTGILWNTPILEKLGLHRCTFVAPPTLEWRMKMASHKCRGSSPVTHDVLWCKNLKSIDIECWQEDEAQLARVLSEISEKMLLEQWQKVKMSSRLVTPQ
uniref:F-box domain-containing protein n=1 Tax=Hordeum vulgare subsp. vulgare TaxID=112509 RepID=A0A8I6YFK8_HORVV